MRTTATWLLSVLMVWLAVPAANAQIYGNQSEIVTFDPSTGAVAGTGLPTPANGVFQGESTADIEGRRLFLLGPGAAPGQTTLTTIAASAGTETPVTLSFSSPFVEYDPTSRRVYAQDNSGVVAIDPSTGSVTATGVPLITGVYNGESTFDPIGRRIFLLGASGTPGQSTLTTIALPTLTVTQVTVPGSSPFVEYDPASTRVYAMLAGGIVAIDPVTGVITPTGLSPIAGGVYNGESTFDPIGRRIYLLGGSGAPGQSALTTVNLSTFTTSQVLIVGTSAFVEFLLSSSQIPALHGGGLLLLLAALAAAGFFLQSRA